MSKICPICKSVAEYNAYYGRITCTRCSWESKSDTKTCANHQNKKGNMAYWDEIDELAVNYTEELMKYSTKPVILDDLILDREDLLIAISKEITGFATSLLKSYGAVFPYVDENY